MQKWVKYLKHPHKYSKGSQGVEGELGGWRNHDGGVPQRLLLGGDQDKEDDDGDDGQDHDENADKEARVGPGAVDGVVVGRSGKV